MKTLDETANAKWVFSEEKGYGVITSKEKKFYGKKAARKVRSLKHFNRVK